MARVRRTRGVLAGRSAEVVERVLAAALKELGRFGYASFRVDRVAERAAVNKTTVYRRWPTRKALVGAVVERLQRPLVESPLPDTGALERDLLEAFARRHEYLKGAEGRAWTRLLAERHTPEVAELIGPVVSGRGDEWQALVRRAVTRRELPARTSPKLVLDLVRAVVDARADGPLDVDWLTRGIKTILAGARAGTLVEPRSA